jgi:GTP-binding protein
MPTFVKSAFRPADMPPDQRPHIALLGRSNVGKSSLVNHLAGAKKLARTSQTPGLTNAINLYDFDGRYYLADLPGYGYSKAALSRGKGFEQMLTDYLSEVPNVKLVFLVIDVRRGFEEDDLDLLAQLAEQQTPYAVIFNKTDKLSNSDVTLNLRRFRADHPDIPALTHSVNSSRGLGEIRDIIERIIRG